MSTNLQATLCGAQASSTSIGTISMVDVCTTIKALTTGFGAINQSTETTAPIYLDFNLPDTLDSRLESNKVAYIGKAVSRFGT